MKTVAQPNDDEPLLEHSEKSDTETSHTSAGETTTQDSSISNGDDMDDKQETVDLKIIWNKNKYDLKIPVDSTGAKLKDRIHSLTGKRVFFFFFFRLNNKTEVLCFVSSCLSSLQVFRPQCRK